MHCFWWNNISVVPALLTLPNFFSLSLSPMQEFGYRWLSKDAEHAYWNFNIEALSWEKDNSFFLQGPEYHCIPDAGTFPYWQLFLEALASLESDLPFTQQEFFRQILSPRHWVKQTYRQKDSRTTRQQDNKEWTSCLRIVWCGEWPIEHRPEYDKSQMR